jgi:dihydroxy-acid dehydratase
MAAAAGRQIVENIWHQRKPSSFLTRHSFLNAVMTYLAIGGSTNAIVHLLALARRAQVELTLADFDTLSRRTPLLLNLRPAGKFLMEDFYYAGGLRALLEAMRPLLFTECHTVNGRSLGENVAGAEIYQKEVITVPQNPLAAEAGTAVLTGNLCPNGAVIKHAAASPHLLSHTGPAVVFRDYPDLVKRLDDPDLPITAESVMVLQSAGPKGAPGMPEWGMLPLPKKLLKAGVRDLVRLSDARMSGTSYGTCVLHISPESAVGGPLALVQDGDLITLDVPGRRLHWHVEEPEAARRAAAWKKPAPYAQRGYLSLFAEQVTQAHEGCDFEFLHSGPATPEPAIF